MKTTWLFLLFCLLLAAPAVAQEAPAARAPEFRLKVNPLLLATGEFGLIGEYRKSIDRSFEVKLAYQQFPATLYNNIQPPNRGPVVQLGVKQYFSKSRTDVEQNSWYGGFLLYKRLQHDPFWFPNKEEITSANTNVAGAKVLKGTEWHVKSLLFEPYYGLSMRFKWGSKTVHCEEVPEGTECPDDGTIVGTESVFGFYPAVHLGIRVGLVRQL